MAPQTEGTANFHASKEYLALNDKQRVWVDIFVATQDAALATQTAYSPATVVYGKLLQYKIEATARIRAALNRYLGRSEEEVFLDEVQETMRRAPKGSDRQVRAQALYARLKYDIRPDAADPEPAQVPPAAAPAPKVATPAPAVLPKPKHWIGERVSQRGPDGIVHWGDITEMVNGRVTNIEEVPSKDSPRWVPSTPAPAVPVAAPAAPAEEPFDVAREWEKLLTAGQPKKDVS